MAWLSLTAFSFFGTLTNSKHLLLLCSCVGAISELSVITSFVCQGHCFVVCLHDQMCLLNELRHCRPWAIKRLTTLRWHEHNRDSRLNARGIFAVSKSQYTWIFDRHKWWICWRSVMFCTIPHTYFNPNLCGYCKA